MISNEEFMLMPGYFVVFQEARGKSDDHWFVSQYFVDLSPREAGEYFSAAENMYIW